MFTYADDYLTEADAVNATATYIEVEMKTKRSDRTEPAKTFTTGQSDSYVLDDTIN